MTKSMLERDPLKMGIIGTTAIIVVLVIAFNFDRIPFVNRGETMHAEFSDASGLATGDAVQVAGVKVGEVESIKLAGDQVNIEFKADTGKQHLGRDTTATIKVETALGRRYIELTPRGTGELGGTIPIARTTAGYDITRSLEEVTQKVASTDKTNLSTALNQISSVAEALPPDLQSSIRGLSRLSETVGSRDDAVRELLANTGSVTKVLADRNQQLVSLFGDGQTLFAALNTRAATIHDILIQARQVADALTGIAVDNDQTLNSALRQLNGVLDILNNNYDNINQAISGLQRFTTQVGEAVGSGPFFGVLLQNILPANISGQQSNSPGGPR
jgi:phospholipid/cholesterol/gamma-HCH transport system substrate-binding protein